MDGPPKKSVVWVYSKDHTEHPFITLGANTLLEQGFAITVIDSATAHIDLPYSHIRLGPSFRKLQYIIRLRGIWRIDKFRLSAASKIRFFRMIWHTLRARPDTVIASHPFGMLAGWIAARLAGARFVYYSFEMYGQQPSPYKPLVKMTEKLLVRYGMDALITQNEKRAEYYVQRLNSRVKPVIVHNYKPRLLDVPESSGKLHHLAGIPSHHRIVLYEGMLQLGRWLDRLLQAAPLLPEDVHLVMMGMVQSGWEELTGELLADPAIASKVSIIPWVPHEELLQYVVDAALGIIIYDDSVLNNYYCEPGKLSDYLNAGIPVIAPDFPTIGKVVREYNIGLAFRDPAPEIIADAIKQVLAVSPESWHESIETALESIRWETQVPAFLEAVLGEAE